MKIEKFALYENRPTYISKDGVVVSFAANPMTGVRPPWFAALDAEVLNVAIWNKEGDLITPGAAFYGRRRTNWVAAVVVGVALFAAFAAGLWI